ncbi:MAG: hypothetical protein ACI4EU_05095 [Butyrivibrio sp.]
MSKFKIGDRVKFVGYEQLLKGKIGTVVVLGDDYLDAGVAFDVSMPFLHDLDGICKNQHGWYCFINELELINEEHRFNVIITSVGDITTAKLLNGKKVEKEVTVNRYHKDEYSEKEAVKAVCKKLFSEDEPEKEPEPFGIDCKAVYIAKDDIYYFTRGKVYEFSDGRCVDDIGNFFPPLICEKIIKLDVPWITERFVKIVGDTGNE